MTDSRSEIDMDYRTAMKEAAELEEIAAEIERVSGTSLESTMHDIGAGWTGESASRFLAKGQHLRKSLSDNGRKVQDIAESLRRTAEQTYQAEMQNITTAKKM